MTDELATPHTTEVVVSDVRPSDRYLNPVLVYLVGLSSEHSRRTMRNALDVIAGLLSNGHSRGVTFPWPLVRAEHGRLVRKRLAERYAPATVNKMLSALRGVLKVCWQLGQMDMESYRRAVAVESVIGESAVAGRPVSLEEISALLEACAADPSPAGARDAAIIALLYGCGLRRAELAGLGLDDYEAEQGELRVGGPRGRERRVPVVNGAAQALADWLQVRGDGPGPLFVSIRKGGHVQHAGARLTTQAVYNVLRRRSAEAGVGEISPNDLRRAFVRDLLDAGADILTVQHLAGHSSPATTARYDRRSTVGADPHYT